MKSKKFCVWWVHWNFTAYIPCSFWSICIFSLWMKIVFFFVFTGSVLICESTLSNGCLNRVGLIHCPKYCLLCYIFNGDSHIVPTTHTLSHSPWHTHRHTRTPLMEEKTWSSWKHDYDASFSSLRCICHLVFVLPDSKISPRYFSILVCNCFVDYILTFIKTHSVFPFGGLFVEKLIWTIRKTVHCL